MKTLRQRIDFYSKQYNISASLLREVLILGARTVLIDFPSYPDGDPRDADEIIDTWLMKPNGFID